VTAAEADAAARLLERLLTDSAFREHFRRNPVVASREAGLAGVAEEMAMSAGKALDTLDGRESRSSLAGVFMAAAVEGAGVYDFSSNLVPHLDGIPEQVEQVLARVHSHGALTPPAGLAEVGVPGSATPLTEEPPAPPNAAGEFTAITPEQAPAGAAPAPAPAPEPADAAPADAAPAPGNDGGDDDGEDDSASDDDNDEQEDDDGSDGEQPDADDGQSGGDGSDGDHDDNSDGTPGSGGEGAGKGGGDAGSDTGGGDNGDGGLDVGDATAGTPGEDAPPAEVAAWMAGQAQKRGLPPELPVMAALVESSMHNLDHGDADSLGYFQMRSSVWDQGGYAGYANHPELQMKWFLDQAEAVKRQRIAAGKPVDDPNSYGEWIADVEQPRQDYRGRYQPRLDEARELLRQGAGKGRDHGGGGADVQLDAVAEKGDDGSGGPRAIAAVAEARKYLGTPYQWGGSTPKTGFDCSGLVQWAYAKAGIRLPRTSEQQILASNGTPVDRAQLERGDLVFFRNSAGDVHHVGISLGGDRFVNAPHTGARVRINSLKEPYFAGEFAGGRRFDVAADGEARPVEVDAEAASKAEAALAHDAAEVQRPGTLLFEAVKVQELRKAQELRDLNQAQVLTTVDPSSAR
jgi:cell wall-associated NlpC family hydrolase